MKKYSHKLVVSRNLWFINRRERVLVCGGCGTSASWASFLIYQSRFIATGAVSSWGICIPQLISVDEIGEFLWRVLSGRKRLRLAKWVLSVVVWIMMTSKSMWIQLVLYIGTVHVSVALFRNFLMWYVSNSYYSFLFFWERGGGSIFFVGDICLNYKFYIQYLHLWYCYLIQYFPSIAIFYCWSL